MRSRNAWLLGAVVAVGGCGRVTRVEMGAETNAPCADCDAGTAPSGAGSSTGGGTAPAGSASGSGAATATPTLSPAAGGAPSQPLPTLIASAGAPAAPREPLASRFNDTAACDPDEVCPVLEIEGETIGALLFDAGKLYVGTWGYTTKDALHIIDLEGGTTTRIEPPQGSAQQAANNPVFVRAGWLYLLGERATRIRTEAPHELEEFQSGGPVVVNDTMLYSCSGDEAGDGLFMEPLDRSTSPTRVPGLPNESCNVVQDGSRALAVVFDGSINQTWVVNLGGSEPTPGNAIFADDQYFYPRSVTSTDTLVLELGGGGLFAIDLGNPVPRALGTSKWSYADVENDWLYAVDRATGDLLRAPLSDAGGVAEVVLTQAQSGLPFDGNDPDGMIATAIACGPSEVFWATSSGTTIFRAPLPQP